MNHKRVKSPFTLRASSKQLRRTRVSTTRVSALLRGLQMVVTVMLEITGWHHDGFMNTGCLGAYYNQSSLLDMVRIATTWLCPRLFEHDHRGNSILL